MPDKSAAITKCNQLPEGQAKACTDFVEFCDRAPDGRRTIVTTDGEIEVPDEPSCFEMAPGIAAMGFRLAHGVTRPDPRPEPQPRPSPSSQPEGTVAAMREDEARAGFCTERTGFVPEPRAKIIWVDGRHRIVVDGKTVAGGQDSIPILQNRPKGSGLRTRMLFLPSRDIHFKKNKAVPVNRRAFDGTIDRMIADVSSTLSGPFSKVCALDYLKEFAGDMVLYVVGKTDRLGSDAHNLKLSNERARTVAEAIGARRGEISGSLWAGSHRGLRVEYIGVGESMTETADGVPSPQDRRVELYLSTDGPPVGGEWTEVVDPNASAVDPSDPFAYYCSGADSDCAAALAQCESAMSVMCEEAYPFSEAGERRCKSMVGGAMSQGSVGDGEVRRWLREGFFSFPIFYEDGGAGRVERFDSLKRCLAKAPAIANRYSVSASAAAGLGPQHVVDPAAVKGSLRKSEFYCSAEHGWMQSSKVWLSKTPMGELLWYGDEPVGVIGRDKMLAKRARMSDRMRENIVPSHHVDPADVDRVAGIAAGEIIDLALGGAFTRRCLGGVPSRLVMLSFTVTPDLALDEDALARLMEDFNRALSDKIESHPGYWRLRNRILISAGVYLSEESEQGLFVTVKPVVSKPDNYLDQQGDYQHSPGGSGADGPIKVLPLR